MMSFKLKVNDELYCLFHLIITDIYTFFQIVISFNFFNKKYSFSYFSSLNDLFIWLSVSRWNILFAVLKILVHKGWVSWKGFYLYMWVKWIRLFLCSQWITLSLQHDYYFSRFSLHFYDTCMSLSIYQKRLFKSYQYTISDCRETQGAWRKSSHCKNGKEHALRPLRWVSQRSIFTMRKEKEFLMFLKFTTVYWSKALLLLWNNKSMI